MDKRRVIGLIAFILLLLAIGGIIYFDRPAQGPATVATAPGGDVAEGPESDGADTSAAEAPEDVAALTPEVADPDADVSADEAAGQAAEAAEGAPSFDIVRVEISGDTVIAGQSPPNALVEILDAGNLIASTTADARGEWTVVLETPLAPGTHDLSIRTTSEDGAVSMLSDQRVTVSVPEKGDDGLLVVLNTPDKPTQVLQISPASDADAGSSAGATGTAEIASAAETAAGGTASDATGGEAADSGAGETANAGGTASEEGASGTSSAVAESAAAGEHAPQGAQAGSDTVADGASQTAEGAVDAASGEQEIALADEGPAGAPEATTGEAETAAVEHASGVDAPVDAGAQSGATADTEVAIEGGAGVAASDSASTEITSSEPTAGGEDSAAGTATGGAVTEGVAGVESAAADAGEAGLAEASSDNAGGATATAEAGGEGAALGNGASEEDSEEAQASGAAAEAGSGVGEAAEGAAGTSQDTEVDSGSEGEVAAGETGDTPDVQSDAAEEAAEPEPTGPQPVVAVAAVEAETSGRLYVAGTAATREPVRVYIDGEMIGETVPSPSGTWLIELMRELPAGTYTVRVDQVSSDGTVIARSEVPFEREVHVATLKPTATTGTGEGASLSGAMPELETVIIKRGDNLWNIARGTWGKGIRWSTIYQANNDQIRDPDLIYPGQVFLLPKGDANWPEDVGALEK